MVIISELGLRVVFGMHGLDESRSIRTLYDDLYTEMRITGDPDRFSPDPKCIALGNLSTNGWCPDTIDNHPATDLYMVDDEELTAILAFLEEL